MRINAFSSYFNLLTSVHKFAWCRPMRLKKAMTAGAVWIAIALTFAIGVVVGQLFSPGHTGDISNWFVALGTLSAVAVALWQTRNQRVEASSTLYFDKAQSALEAAVRDFLDRLDPDGRPRNGRRHWLNFARGIANAQRLAKRIDSPELKEIWTQTEHYWRERVYDILKPTFESYPAEYYGYTGENEVYKNLAFGPGEREPISEASLVLVYTWVAWPDGMTDPLDRRTRFTDEKIEQMATFGPRGLARYIRILRSLAEGAQGAAANAAQPQA